MIPPSVKYLAPASLPEPLAALKLYENVRMLAVGQGPGPQQSFTRTSRCGLVDISRVKVLSGIKE